MQSLVLPLCTTLAASLPRQLTHSLLLCPLLPCTWLSSFFSGSFVQSEKLASAPLPAAAPWFPLPAVRAAPFSHSAPSHCLLINCPGKGLPGACLVWCLCSRCSALNYTLLHGTSSTWFVPKALAYNSLHFAREAVVLVGGCEPWAQGFQASSFPFAGQVQSEICPSMLPRQRSSQGPASYLSPAQCAISDERCLDSSPSASVVLPWTLDVPFPKELPLLGFPELLGTSLHSSGWYCRAFPNQTAPVQ